MANARRILIAPHNAQWAAVVRDLWPLADVDCAQLECPPGGIYTTWYPTWYRGFIDAPNVPIYDVRIITTVEHGTVIYARNDLYTVLTDCFALLFGECTI